MANARFGSDTHFDTRLAIAPMICDSNLTIRLPRQILDRRSLDELGVICPNHCGDVDALINRCAQCLADCRKPMI